MSKFDWVEYLEIDITTRCNLNCAYCRGRFMPQEDIDPALYQRALDLFPRLRHIEMHGEGEPMLHPDFFDLAACARSRDIELSLFTNGTQLHTSNIERILEIGFRKIIISIDSADEGSFQEIRGGGRLTNIIEGVAQLMRMRRAANMAAPAIGFSVTVQRKTLSHLPGIVALYRSLDLDGGIGYQPLNPMQQYARHYPAELAPEAMTLAELDDHFCKLCNDPEVSRAIAGTSPYKGFFDELFEPIVLGDHLCPWVERGAYLTVRGFVTGCCMITEPYAFGRIGNDDHVHIVREHAKMQGRLYEGRIPVPCQACEVASLITDPLRSQSEEPLAGLEDVRSMKPTINHLQGETAAPSSQAQRQTHLLELTLASERAKSNHLLLALEDARHEVRALRRSWSWRITAPLREAYEFLGLHRRNSSKQT